MIPARGPQTVCLMQSLFCNHSAIFALQSFAMKSLLFCNLCSAIVAMQSLLCNLCYAIFAFLCFLSSDCKKYYKTCAFLQYFAENVEIRPVELMTPRSSLITKLWFRAYVWPCPLDHDQARWLRTDRSGRNQRNRRNDNDLNHRQRPFIAIGNRCGLSLWSRRHRLWAGNGPKNQNLGRPKWWSNGEPD